MDHYFFGNYDTMEKIMTSYTKLNEIKSDDDVVYTGEGLLYREIIINNISLKRFKLSYYVLRKNKKGSSLIHLYYLTGPEVSKILEKNRSLSQEALLILNECMPKIKLKLKGSDVNLSEKIRTDIKNFAGHLSLHGSPMLKKVIEQFLRDLDHGRLF